MSETPKHIAIIMDGNNRYGKAQALPKGGGHIAGKDALDPIVEHCARLGVQVLTVFAFSSENWARPPDEVALLMSLFEKTIHDQVPRMHAHQIRLRFIGDRSRLDDRLQQLMQDAERATAHFERMTLVIAVSYGGRADIAYACQAVCQQVLLGAIPVDAIDEQAVGRFVELADVPPVDMLIRTGGDHRLSNFLLWQTAYAELFFSPTLWPEFGIDELDVMIAEFGQRERRFGKTSEQLAKR